MSLFERDPWTTNALIIISAQIHNVDRKLDAIISGSAPPEQLEELRRESTALRARTDALLASIEKQTQKDK